MFGNETSMLILILRTKVPGSESVGHRHTVAAGGGVLWSNL